MTWKTARWLVLLAFIFGLQLLLIYWLSVRSPIGPGPATLPDSKMVLVTRPLNQMELSKTFLASDPTLFAIPDAHGFSGGAWLKTTERDYDVSEHTESPFWLALDVGDLGKPAEQFVRTNARLPIAIAENPVSKIFGSLPFVDLRENAQTNSQLRIEGEIAARKLIDFPQLKSWVHSEILSNTVAQIAVNQRGAVVVARLLSRSGLAEADDAALDVARQLQFVPVEKSELTWGKVILDWFTAPLPTTNATSELPQAK
jgi:hypothetical protein